MPEPNLNLTHDQLAAKLGLFAGWGQGLLIDGKATGDPAWSSYQTQQIEDALQSGLRRFYYPEPEENSGVMHSWTFLKPVATLFLAASASTIPLPDDYGACEGPITIKTAGATSQPWEICWRNEAQIRDLYSVNATTTGPPQYVAEQVLKGTTPQQGQTKQLYFYPLADLTYTLQVAYYVNPDYLTQATPFPYGGAQHTETVLESCLAVMEERYDDQRTVHRTAFEGRMRASLAMDRRNQPQNLGPNLDRSDWGGNRRAGDYHYAAPAATYNGGSFN